MARWKSIEPESLVQHHHTASRVEPVATAARDAGQLLHVDVNQSPGRDVSRRRISGPVWQSSQPGGAQAG